MRAQNASRWLVLAVFQILLTAPLAAEEFDQLVAVVKKTWPDRKEVAMVCDPATSQPFVNDLKKVAGASLNVKVYAVKGPADIGRAITQITATKTDLLVLVPSDPVAGDGLKEAERTHEAGSGEPLQVLARGFGRHHQR